MKLRYKISIISGVVILSPLVYYLVVFYYPALSTPTPLTSNIPASADISTFELPRTQKTIVVLPNTRLLDVGYNATNDKPIASYIRFDLGDVPQPDQFNTVTFSANLVLLGRFVFPMDTSVDNDTDYIITAAHIICDPLDWTDYDMKTHPCLGDIDNSTSTSILIGRDSIPDFYEWTVTSAVVKALKDKQVTFRMAGFALTPDDFNGGVQFWSRETASYLGSYAGPTEVLIITSEITPSALSNTIVTVSAIVATAAIAWPLTKIVLKR